MGGKTCSSLPPTAYPAATCSCCCCCCKRNKIVLRTYFVDCILSLNFSPQNIWVEIPKRKNVDFRFSSIAYAIVKYTLKAVYQQPIAVCLPASSTNKTNATETLVEKKSLTTVRSPVHILWSCQHTKNWLLLQQVYATLVFSPCYNGKLVRRSSIKAKQ